MHTSRTCLSWLAGVSALGLLSIDFASAHGYMAYPPARQQFCAQDGGYWDSTDGSTIPNLACRAGYLKSGWYPFVQKPEFAKLVSQHRDQAAVEQAIPNGLLCSGGDPKKAGMDLPHAHWQTTAIDPAAAGKLQVKFHATTPHDPSYWYFYLSKPSFDPATQNLTWADLEPLNQQALANVPITDINGQKFYVMDLQLPTNRSGNAILYTRWQRIDPAGEGFYNCSDLNFGQDQSPITWHDAGTFWPSTLDGVANEEAQFRLFDAKGQELIFETLALTADNELEQQWVAQLAQRVNQQYAQQVQIGIEQSDGSVQFDPQQLASNRVFVIDTAYTQRLETRSPNQVPRLTVPKSLTVNSGDLVQFDVQAIDPDGDLIQFTTSHGQVSAASNQAQISWTAPNTASDRTISIEISASDGKTSISQFIPVLIKAANVPNLPPKISGPTQAQGQSGTTLSLPFQGQDPEGQPLSWTASLGQIQTNGQNVTWQWTLPKVPAPKAQPISITLSDGFHTAEHVLTVQIQPTQTPGDTWKAGKTYVKGNQVTYQGVTYEAKWWNRGQTPGQAQVWKALTDPGTTVLWNPQTAYAQGSVVRFGDHQYKARWWNRNKQPDQGGPWQKQ